MARILIVWRMAVAGLLLAWVGPVTAQDGVTARQILVGQSMTLQGGKAARMSMAQPWRKASSCTSTRPIGGAVCMAAPSP
jgi:hypothetical protein